MNWFRKNADGRFAWPGFGENIRVLKWIIQRLSGQVEAVSTPIGNLPAPGTLDLDGLDIPAASGSAPCCGCPRWPAGCCPAW